METDNKLEKGGTIEALGGGVEHLCKNGFPCVFANMTTAHKAAGGRAGKRIKACYL